MSDPRTDEAIRDLARRLEALYRAGCSLTDPVCVALSRQLDRCIVDWYRDEATRADQHGEHPAPQRGAEPAARLLGGWKP